MAKLKFIEYRVQSKYLYNFHVFHLSIQVLKVSRAQKLIDRQYFISVLTVWRAEERCGRRVYAMGIAIPGHEESQHWVKLPHIVCQLCRYTDKSWFHTVGYQRNFQKY